MDEPAIDLTPLDPTRDRVSWERRIRAITALAAPELARRAAEGSPLLVLVDWFRPALAAAGLLAAAALALLVQGASASETTATAQALRLPAPVALWLGEERTPTVAELTIALEGTRP